MTNRKRATLYGCYLPLSPNKELIRIHAPPKSDSRIYFNTPDSLPTENRIRYMAFERTQHPILQPYPESLITKSQCPWTQYNELWFHSSCTMDDVAQITVCRDVSLHHRPIVGMLVVDSHAHTSCLGQFRFDRSLECISPVRGKMLYFRAKRTKERFLYLASVWTNSPADSSEMFLLPVPLKGTLDWWFSHRQTILYHSSIGGPWIPS
jgi:hypothetical protein